MSCYHLTHASSEYVDCSFESIRLMHGICYGNVSSMRHIYEKNHLKTLDSTFFLKLMPENQGHSGRFTDYVQTL